MDGSLDDDAGAGEFPQRDEQLAGERDDQPLARGLALSYRAAADETTAPAPIAVDVAATARPIAAFSFAAGGFPAFDRPCSCSIFPLRQATASGRGRRPPAGGWRRSGKVLPSTEKRRSPPATPLRLISWATAEGRAPAGAVASFLWLASWATSLSRAASTALICSSSNSSRPSSRSICAFRCAPSGRPSPVRSSPSRLRRSRRNGSIVSHPLREQQSLDPGRRWRTRSTIELRRARDKFAARPPPRASAAAPSSKPGVSPRL